MSVPVFRSPPGLPGVDRSLRRAASGAVIVAVRLGDRPVASVHADVIDGVLAANGLCGTEADRFRRAAWRALDGAPAPRSRVPSRGEEVADPPSTADDDHLDDARVA